MHASTLETEDHRGRRTARTAGSRRSSCRGSPTTSSTWPTCRPVDPPRGVRRPRGGAGRARGAGRGPPRRLVGDVTGDRRGLPPADGHPALPPRDRPRRRSSADGEWVASCCVWLDDETGVALVEPVGCVEDHRRLGLATAASVSALTAARELGATHGLVCPRGDDDYPAPARLYQGIGFEPGARTRTWRVATEQQDARRAGRRTPMTGRGRVETVSGHVVRVTCVELQPALGQPLARRGPPRARVGSPKSSAGDSPRLLDHRERPIEAVADQVRVDVAHEQRPRDAAGPRAVHVVPACGAEGADGGCQWCRRLSHARSPPRPSSSVSRRARATTPAPGRAGHARAP